MLEKLSKAPRNLIHFYGDVKSELRKVTWPRKKEVYGTTFVVIVTIFFFGVYLAVVDFILGKGVDWILATFR